MRAPTNNPRISPQCATMSTATCTTSTSDSHHDSSIYARAWRFVQRRLHLRPRACSCPADMENRATTKTVETPEASSVATNSNSYCCDWQRVYMLKELEEAGARAQWRRQRQYQECIKETAEWTPTDIPAFRTQAQRKTAQVTCHNCGLLFFRPLSVASDTSAFCGRDCQSTYEYRRDLQDTVNACETFQSTANWTRSSEL
ncbi:hypothetical protein F441_07246 [Phytophthora nicotianae CJ01A1]|uniref:Uncharacterized protein n=4 Tax=Phytophthora nicotianae TaxID=4792 RepID=V9FDB7_PHYNI|nr:hypothetical protein F443_07230 [Phytophthora nicotianae P1569]ETK88675.1 hypothetical protein L915_07104 [Phytophthora nicotianae]ETP18540.1 hypothetical protein F441_07246 [Phytophthora nicotianae CJ01A1]ETP46462.1 hypothetical protein F442_07298 [Phytophthora nicotianae P10297]ETL42063.1 hypothetical protein L916_07057 [Phytophthora nicotianae]